MKYLLLILLLVVLSGIEQGRAQTAPQGSWEGAVQIQGIALDIIVHFTGEAGALQATIDIPQQGGKDIPLQNVRFDAPALYFELQAGPGLAQFDGRVQDDGSIAGAFRQAGMTGTFTIRPALEATEATAATEAPPYHEQDVLFHNGHVTLAGTLTVPDTTGTHPAVVLITGSGAQDRDVNIHGFKLFRDLADHLTRKGIAVLRYDDRGVGGSSGDISVSTTADFAGDVRAGIAALKKHRGIDPERIGVLGHSEGGLVAGLAADGFEDIAFVILMASPAVRGDSLVLAQIRQLGRLQGLSDAELRDQIALQQRFYAALRTGEGWNELRAEVRERLQGQIEQLPEAQRAGIPDVAAYIEETIDAQFSGIRTPWFRYYLAYDPAPALSRLRVPVLAVFGELDVQVPPSLNAEALREAMQDAEADQLTIETVPQANHLFQTATTGSPEEYPMLEKAFAVGFLDTVTTWILVQAGAE